MFMNLDEDLIKKAKELIQSSEFSKCIVSNISQLKEEKSEQSKSYDLRIDDNLQIDNLICNKFIKFCLDFLKVDGSDLIVILSGDKDNFKTFAFYSIGDGIAAVYAANRHIMDVFRSLAHELVHYKQDITGAIKTEQTGDDNDGQPIENEANSIAGVIMRKFGREHPELY